MDSEGTVTEKARASRFAKYKRSVHNLPEVPWEAFFSAQEIADTLKVNIMTIYRYIKAGKLTAYKFGKEFRITEENFQTFLNNSISK